MYKKFVGLTGSDIIYKKLLEYGVNTVSIYSGGAIMPLVDKFNYNTNKYIKYYVHSHEQMCGHSSTGYAKASGNMGVSIVTSGPGLTNMITPMLDATNDSTPLMVISGQVSKNVMGTMAFQECDAINITKPVTKFSHCIKTVEEIPQIMDIAYYLANNKKKGTVHIDLPKCVATAVFKNNGSDDVYAKNLLKYRKSLNLVEKNHKYKNSNDIKYISEIAEKINNSKKPILYLGQGVNGLSKKVLKFIEKNNIPVTTTIHALGIIDQSHNLSLKWLGMHGYAPANYAIQESDCIICVGARFDDRTTGDIKKYAPKAKDIIHVNIESSEIKKIVNSNYNIVDSAENFFDKIYPYSIYKKRFEWINKLNKWKKKYPFEYDILDDKLNMQMVINEINNQIKDDTIITTGVGTHQMQTAQFINWKPGMRFISSGSLGVMGVGIPYGIGAKLANMSKDVIVIDGDASSLMTITDLKTIKQYNIPIKIIILNNNKQGMVYIWEKLFFNGNITATEYDSNPSFTKLANSFGIKSLYCDKPSKLKNTINKFIEYDGPILMECNVINDICTPLVKPGGGLDEMIFKKDYLNKIKMNGDIPN